MSCWATINHFIRTTPGMNGTLVVGFMLPVILTRKMLAFSVAMVGVVSSTLPGSSESKHYQASEARVPTFSDYRVKQQYKGRIANPKIDGHWRKFRTRINEVAGRPPNFAGAYRLVKWGCGSDCITFALVDLRDGSIHDPPFESLWLDAFAVYGWHGKGLVFRSDSGLLIVDGCPSEKCATYYYEWTGTSFSLVYTLTKHPKD
jgi:hypothetical protein